MCDRCLLSGLTLAGLLARSRRVWSLPACQRSVVASGRGSGSSGRCLPASGRGSGRSSDSGDRGSSGRGRRGSGRREQCQRSRVVASGRSSDSGDRGSLLVSGYKMVELVSLSNLLKN